MRDQVKRWISARIYRGLGSPSNLWKTCAPWRFPSQVVQALPQPLDWCAGGFVQIIPPVQAVSRNGEGSKNTIYFVSCVCWSICEDEREGKGERREILEFYQEDLPPGTQTSRACGLKRYLLIFAVHDY